MKQKLGSRLQGASFAVRGRISETQGIKLLYWVISLIKMTPYGDPIVRKWPTDAGAGGAGLTLFMSLTESFAVVESFDDHSGFYLIINSCKDFDPYKVWSFIETLGYRVIGADGSLVRLVKRRSWMRRLLDWWQIK